MVQRFQVIVELICDLLLYPRCEGFAPRQQPREKQLFELLKTAIPARLETDSSLKLMASLTTVRLLLKNPQQL